MTADPNAGPAEDRTPAWALVVAWTVVTVPLAWGVYMTILGALKLFTS